MSASLCDVCGQNPAAGVSSMPGVPVSFAYCKDCFEANAHPYAIVVANTAMLGGLASTATWWQHLVNCTLAHLGKTHEEFAASVLADQQEFEAAEARANEEFAKTEEGSETCWSLLNPPQDGGAV
jgi:hypothetical protein